MAIDIELDMRVDPDNEVTMTVDDGDEVEFEVGEAIVVKDHAILDNRDLPDQHPISAITGLAEALAESGKINTVKVNGTALPIVDKAVDVPVPTKVSEIEDDLVYNLGTIYPDASTNMFALTQEQHGEILAMIHRAGDRKCYLAFDYAGDNYTLPSAGLMNYRGVLFYIFQEYNPSIGGLAGSMFVIGIATNMGIGGMILVHLLTEDDVQTSVTGIVNGDYIIDRLGYTPYPDTNPANYITSSDVPAYSPVHSVNGQTGTVVLSASDVGALPNTTDLSVYMQKGVDCVTAGKKSGTTLGNKATAEGANNTASGSYAHAEGSNTVASGSSSHAEGSNTVAGYQSHAEGFSTEAAGTSHAEGTYTLASATSAHAEGYHTEAKGDYSHAEGKYTEAYKRSQHVFGEYNRGEGGAMGATIGTYVEIVGNGTDDTHRSNARTLDWSGNEVLAGTLTVGADPTNAMEVATKQYVDGAIPTVPTNVSSFTNDAGYLVASDLIEATDADVIAIVV